MKNVLSILLFVASWMTARLSAAESSLTINVPAIGTWAIDSIVYRENDSPAKADFDGVYRRVADSTAIVSLSVNGLVLECTYTPRRTFMCAVDHGGAPCPDWSADRTVRWREVYVVRDGKLVLAEVIRPKVTPAQPQKVEWPAEASPTK